MYYLARNINDIGQCLSQKTRDRNVHRGGKQHTRAREKGKEKWNLSNQVNVGNGRKVKAQGNEERQGRRERKPHRNKERDGKSERKPHRNENRKQRKRKKND